jgi:hypothetical protein
LGLILFFSGDGSRQIFDPWVFAAKRPPLLKLCAHRYGRAYDGALARDINLKSTEFSTRMVENCGDRD